jgi:hypothetical protein
LVPIVPWLIGVEGYRLYLLEHPGEVLTLSYLEYVREIMKDYTFKWGKYYVEISYRTDKDRAPNWHAQVTILEEIGEGEWGTAQEALLALESWTPTDLQEAREILGEALGDEIVRTTQQVVEHRGQWSLHWATSDERAGERDPESEAKN